MFNSLKETITSKTDGWMNQLMEWGGKGQKMDFKLSLQKGRLNILWTSDSSR
jgi:hypothetical protein